MIQYFNSIWEEDAPGWGIVRQEDGVENSHEDEDVWESEQLTANDRSEPCF